jgi:general secretion pathway protein N
MLRRWLATLAAPAADGSTHIRRHGGLAANASPAPTH